MINTFRFLSQNLLAFSLHPFMDQANSNLILEFVNTTTEKTEVFGKTLRPQDQDLLISTLKTPYRQKH
ncbi:MAG: hypothetical protein KKF98_15780 [Bacteroidetes bacterium]|nr:hypothetical protein [Bacteroidota bacterium]